MFFVGKKTVYLSMHEKGERLKTVGFMQLIGKEGRIRLSLKIKDAGECINGRCSVYLLGEEKETEIGKILFEIGTGTFEKMDIPVGEISGLRVPLTEGKEILGMMPGACVKKSNDITALSHDLISQPMIKKDLHDDKWERILKQYKVVHPFGDDRAFVALELKDFVVLAEQYQRLMYNSFLLHGFYNYRHVILGKNCKLRDFEKDCYYLGVPGVYYEREKQVAVMFGFEGFESADCIEVGKFGYYMREVKI